MAHEQNSSHKLRSIGAVFAGIFVGAIPSIGTDVVLRLAGIFPALGTRMADNLFLLATFYRIVYSILGSYVTARLAPDRPMQHALAGGVVGLIVGTVGAVMTWNRGPAFGPHWYPVVLIVLALPTAWVGGRLRQAQLGAPKKVSAQMS